jgi:N-acyl-D-amino-acid deacylase
MKQDAPGTAGTVWIRGGFVVDGTGAKPKRADVWIANGQVVRIGPNVNPENRQAQTVVDASGRIVAPGFIDAHSHADGGIFENATAETQIRQGITTSIVGQDGGSNYPLQNWFARLEARPAALNFASFVGHGTLRGQVLGKSYQREATPSEIRQMRVLLAREMKAGALGLSSGLEYEPGLFANTKEVVALAEVAGIYNGMYISHVRDEEDGAFESFGEVVQIAREARLPAQISHIKLGAAPVWNRTGDVFRLLDKAQSAGLDVSADVYPYTYWQSTVTTLLTTRDFTDIAAWRKALAEVGGGENILVSSFSPEKSWEGQTVAQIAKRTNREPAAILADLATRTRSATGERTGSESVVVTAMREADLRAFIAHPQMMFCTDGGLRGSHPRGAGSYPRILGRYVRETRTLPLEQAVYKASGLPAKRFSLARRGTLTPGNWADVVVFDPRTVSDTATTANPRSAPVGIDDVLVNGVPVLRNGQVTGNLPGRVLRRGTI